MVESFRTSGKNDTPKLFSEELQGHHYHFVLNQYHAECSFQIRLTLGEPLSVAVHAAIERTTVRPETLCWCPAAWAC